MSNIKFELSAENQAKIERFNRYAESEVAKALAKNDIEGLAAQLLDYWKLYNEQLVRCQALEMFIGNNKMIGYALSNSRSSRKSKCSARDIIKMKANGMSNHAIALECGVSDAAISKRLKHLQSVDKTYTI